VEIDLRGKSVFLTGASGFVGGRLAECLTEAYGARVHALVHRAGTAGTARLARLKDVRIFLGDLRKLSSLEEAARGCSFMIHCAFGNQGKLREQEQVTIEGTRNVLVTARRMGVERGVYFSSASVQRPGGRTDDVREDDPLDGNFPYARMKIAAENLVRKESRQTGVPFVILRPTCVWGPFSPVWTLGSAELIRRRIPFLPKNGTGAANVVFIDNLVDAVYLSLTRPEAAGEVFLVNDDAPLTWAELYGGYAAALGATLLFPSRNRNDKGLAGVWDKSMTGVISFLKNAGDHSPVVRRMWNSMSEPIKQKVRDRAALSPSLRELYEAERRYSNEKAKRLLGWRPRTDFDTALRKTGRFLMYYFWA
jgi:nucleoside-diphosphate-sugar epimerase